MTRMVTLDQVDQFLSLVDSCRGNIYLTSKYGDRFNLKSKLSQFLAISAILDSDADDLDIQCADHEDDSRLRHFLLTH
ncbi:MAG: hypothetical protein MJ117_02610 [Lachnospiraceae bacterium]|nr:hypothetical protein [Lachnospiraceae bacterium]